MNNVFTSKQVFSACSLFRARLAAYGETISDKSTTDLHSGRTISAQASVMVYLKIFSTCEREFGNCIASSVQPADVLGHNPTNVVGTYLLLGRQPHGLVCVTTDAKLTSASSEPGSIPSIANTPSSSECAGAERRLIFAILGGAPCG